MSSSKLDVTRHAAVQRTKYVLQHLVDVRVRVAHSFEVWNAVGYLLLWYRG